MLQVINYASLSSSISRVKEVTIAVRYSRTTTISLSRLAQAAKECDIGTTDTSPEGQDGDTPSGADKDGISSSSTSTSSFSWCLSLTPHTLELPCQVISGLDGENSSTVLTRPPEISASAASLAPFRYATQ